MVDVASRRVLAHKVAITLEACHASEVIEQAFARFGMPEIVNTDQGSQFTAEDFTKAVLSRGCRLSMDGKGAWRDNVFVERLWRTIKYERVYLRAYDGVSVARADLEQFIHWYNHEHRHSAIRYLAPAQRHAGLDAPILQARQRLYQQARQRHPARWSGKLRNWQPIGSVWLNPEPDQHEQDTDPVLEAA